jgi:hypothetical protein
MSKATAELAEGNVGHDQRGVAPVAWDTHCSASIKNITTTKLGGWVGYRTTAAEVRIRSADTALEDSHVTYSEGSCTVYPQQLTEIRLCNSKRCNLISATPCSFLRWNEIRDTATDSTVKEIACRPC